jgi:hypothetical protein
LQEQELVSTVFSFDKEARNIGCYPDILGPGIVNLAAGRLADGEQGG